ncbi:MAG: hypothetical protein CBB71_00380 [Rhodopirellula sp. TMED11]|nr:MAG: hypothetical protein CBB71_00380 [Rhodopirellula sp. TMED11]
MTLDPPGSIAVIGAGPMGIEAALYGRFLGYNIALYEAAEQIAASLQSERDEQLPQMPSHCMSPLALRALEAQGSSEAPSELPTTIDHWITRVWEPLAASDLLRGRVQTGKPVTDLRFAEPDDEDEDHQAQQPADSEAGAADSDPDQAVPPDFQLSFGDESTEVVEAVIVATGTQHWAATESHPTGIAVHFDLPAEYLFQVTCPCSDQTDADYLSGLKQIVKIYAQLAGREDLDLYKPVRGPE